MSDLISIERRYSIVKNALYLPLVALLFGLGAATLLREDASPVSIGTGLFLLFYSLFGTAIFLPRICDRRPVLVVTQTSFFDRRTMREPIALADIAEIRFVRDAHLPRHGLLRFLVPTRPLVALDFVHARDDLGASFSAHATRADHIVDCAFLDGCDATFEGALALLHDKNTRRPQDDTVVTS